MSIFSTIKQAKVSERESDLCGYYRFLAKLNPESVAEKDRATLANFLAKLDKTPEQAEADRLDVSKLQDTLRIRAETENAEKLLDSATNVHTKACAARQDLLHEQNRLVTSALTAMDFATGERQRKYSSMNVLNAMREENPILFNAIAGK
jgi:hypothetical protein